MKELFAGLLFLAITLIVMQSIVPGPSPAHRISI